MVTNPIDYVEHMAKAGASGFTFHVEVAKGILAPFQTILIFYGFDLNCLFQRIGNNLSAGMRPAVALKPVTPVELVYPLV